HVVYCGGGAGTDQHPAADIGTDRPGKRVDRVVHVHPVALLAAVAVDLWRLPLQHRPGRLRYQAGAEWVLAGAVDGAEGEHGHVQVPGGVAGGIGLQREPARTERMPGRRAVAGPGDPGELGWEQV